MRQRALVAVFTSIFAMAGCNKARQLPGEPTGSYEVPLGDPTGGAGGPTAILNVGFCTRCHGDATLDNTGADPLYAAAPPKTLLNGATGPAAGAHAAHLKDGPFRKAVECASCHLLPTGTEHPAQKMMGKVSFSRLSTTAWSGSPAPAPVWNGTTCASTYCHGRFKNGANATLAWTDTGVVACGSCHGVSATNGPGGSHPTLSAGENCGSCHGGSYTNTAVDLTLHMNGRLDGGGHPAGWKEPDQHGLAALGGGLDACTTCHTGFGPAGSASAGSSCDLCHATPSDYGPYATGTYPNHADWQTECTFCHGGRGGDTTGAPPRNTHVISSDTTTAQLTTDPTIGAHRSHVNALHSISTAVDCTACHETKWTNATQLGHVDKATADVYLLHPVGASANAGSYSTTSSACSSTYCHGNFAGGAGAGPVAWTGSFGATFTLGCGSCHGFPPGPTSSTVHHPPNTSCGSCHTGYPPGTVVAATHVDGTVQHTPAAGCTQCHGDLGASDVASGDVRAAPAGDASAVDAHGHAATLTSNRGIGAHAAHLTGTTWRSAPIACGECHAVPATGDVTHANGNPALAFGTLASTAWAGQPAITPTWNGANGATTLTCSSTYCHGAFKNGAAAAPTWASPSAVACGSCHAVSATNGPGGTHPTFTASENCGSCHGGSYTNTTVDKSLHMNGVVDGGGHPAGWKEPDQHGLAALQQVGGLGPCTSCHVGFGPVGAAASSSCNLCHATPSAYGPYTTGTYPNHTDWQTECTFCHGGRPPPAGGDTTGAPPRNTHVISSDTTTAQLTTDATIGAHRSHVDALHAISTAVDCTACHQTRWASATDAGHIDKTVADVYLLNPVGPSADAGSYTRPSCSSTYCHGNFTGGAGAGPIAWTGSFGATFTLGCGSCHGFPPGPTSSTVHHPPNSSCGSCHTGYPPGTVVAATHVDGTVQHTPASGCTQCHGDLGVSGVANTDVRAAPAGDASAVDAHGNASTSTGSRGIGAHAAHLGGTTWRSAPISCGECHSVPGTGDVTHANGNPAVAFGTLASTAWSGQPAISPTWNGAGGATTLTCSSTYCHGAFKNGSAAAPTWAAPSAVACGSCHAVSATNGPGGTHPTFSTSQTCGSCHGGSYTNTSVDKALHMNGALDVANLTCSSCHGQSTRTPVASATALDALGANLVKDAPPLDAGGGAAATGAHQAHVNQGDTTAPGPLSNALACSVCHTVPTSTSHSNGTVNVGFTGLATTGGVTPTAYDFTNHQCASTYCHGNFTGGAGSNAILWTATGKLACSSCHGAPPAPTSATLHHPPNATCASCHTGYTASTVTASTHVDGTVQHTPATGCTQCHGDLGVSGVANTDVRAAPAGDASAVDAHGNASTSTGSRGVGAHAAHLGGTTWRSTPIACNECHSVPATGDVAHANGDPALAFGTLASTVWTGGSAITPTWNGAGGATTLTCSSTYCHGAFRNGSAAAPTWAAPSSVVCGSCHGVSTTAGPGGTHPTFTTALNCGSCHGGSYTNTSVDKSLHMNGQLDGGGEPTSPGTSCGGCHSTILDGMDGTVAKTSRHGLGSDVPIDDATAWTSPLSGVAAANRSCVNMCHGDHPHDLTSPTVATHENNVLLDASTQASRGGTTRTSATRDSTDFDAAATNGGMCVSCHRNPVTSATGALTVPRDAFNASAHDYTSSTVGANTYAWSYGLHDGGLFARNCTKCHASRTEGTTPASAAAGSATAAVHFSDDASLLAGATTGATSFVCYNCHGSAAAPAAGAQGNRSGKDIQTQIAHATTAGQSGHPANAAVAHDGTTEYANASFGNALGGAARHANCLDCHEPHRAKAGTHAAQSNVAGPPLEGAWGARLSSNPAFWAAPATPNFTKTVMVAGTDVEATLCFKCHSSFYGTLPAAPSWSPNTWPETDTAREFNPNNVGNWLTAGTTSWSSGETAGGFHPVLADAGSNLGAVNLANLVTTNVAWSTTARNLMTCTDCHESDTTTDPNGPHGSAAKFLLRGPNTGWSSTTTMTSSGMPAGTFCANCHSPTFASSRFTQHYSRSNHRVECMNCHAAVPHGGPRPGMLVAISGACTASGSAGGNSNCQANVGGIIAGWDQSSPYAGLPAGNSTLYLMGYPTSRTATWGQNNCGCGTGGGH